MERQIVPPQRKVEGENVHLKFGFFPKDNSISPTRWFDRLAENGYLKTFGYGSFIALGSDGVRMFLRSDNPKDVMITVGVTALLPLVTLSLDVIAQRLAYNEDRRQGRIPPRIFS